MMNDNAKEEIEQLTTLLIEAGVASSESVLGCAEEEIVKMELSRGVGFPAVYRAFLSRMGRGCGNFFQGTSIFYPDVLELGQAARQLLAASGGSSLPDGAWVFFGHQDVSYGYFSGNEDDPVVWELGEESHAPTPGSLRLLAFFAKEVADHIRLAARLGKSKQTI